ncbi:MAG: pyridoxal phosphate-dependent aminotransferase [Bifidobacterium sp.]|jgi:aspartate aminotransferase|nr:pyridoxal phosphate-dependent aminotransferase [Bifidobacterium sp.]
MVAKSATLVMNEMMQHAVAQGRSVINLGFGEAGLPVMPELRKILSADSARNAYPAVQGSYAVRNALSGYFTRRGIPADADHCLMAPGSKALLFAVLQALKGDVVLSRPSWVTYAAQSHMLNKHCVWVDAPESAGGVPDPKLLVSALDSARRAGQNPTTLLLTSPDNPSGTVAGRTVIEQLVHIAKEQNLAIISDEIYRDLAYDQVNFVSPAQLAPERTFVTTGLSKSMALGGWRIGAALFPQNAWGDAVMQEVIGTASEIWSGMPIFLEPVAEYCFSEPSDVLQWVNESRQLHQRVSNEIHHIMVDAGASCRKPSGAFYIYPTFHDSEFAHRLGVSEDESLSHELFERFGIAVLPGSAFGDLPQRMGLRVVTSMMYGTDDESRMETMRMTDPLQAPSVKDGLERVHEVFAGVPSNR